jgi:acetyl esterase/lipase
MNRLIPLAACLMLICSAALAGEDTLNLDNKPVVKVWPGKAPGETGEVGAEHIQNRNPKLGADVIRLANVSEPILMLYRAKTEGPATPTTTVLICPGGGYNILAWNLEGTEIAGWLNSIGVHAAILKYRVPRRKDRPKHEAPLQDAQRAMRLLRANAEPWGVAPDRIGILGFSAGGHLSAAASTNFDKSAYEPIDEADQLSARPDFTVLIYPAYIADDNVTQVAPEIAVTDKTPPAFIVQTEDDRYVDSAIGYSLALKKAKVSAELHVYPEGGHGYGLRETGKTITTWPARCADWMRDRGLIH